MLGSRLHLYVHQMHTSYCTVIRWKQTTQQACSGQHLLMVPTKLFQQQLKEGRSTHPWQPARLIGQQLVPMLKLIFPGAYCGQCSQSSIQIVIIGCLKSSSPRQCSCSAKQTWKAVGAIFYSGRNILITCPVDHCSAELWSIINVRADLTGYVHICGHTNLLLSI